VPQKAFDTLQKVEHELRAVQDVLDEELSDAACIGSRRKLINETRAQTERTYLLRLLADFEGELTRIGPSLRTPVSFTKQDGLATKLNRIGANKGIDQPFRTEIDDKIREHRNELAHGRSPVPRVSFATSHQLMKRFLAWCY
jgi:hypothetical protein